MLRYPERIKFTCLVTAHYKTKEGKDSASIPQNAVSEIKTGKAFVNSKGEVTNKNMSQSIIDRCIGKESKDSYKVYFNFIKYKNIILKLGDAKKCNNFADLIEKLGFSKEHLPTGSDSILMDVTVE